MGIKIEKAARLAGPSHGPCRSCWGESTVKSTSTCSARQAWPRCRPSRWLPLLALLQPGLPPPPPPLLFQPCWPALLPGTCPLKSLLVLATPSLMLGYPSEESPRCRHHPSRQPGAALRWAALLPHMQPLLSCWDCVVLCSPPMPPMVRSHSTADGACCPPPAPPPPAAVSAARGRR